MARKKRRKKRAPAPGQASGSAAAAPQSLPKAESSRPETTISVPMRRVVVALVLVCAGFEILWWLLDYHINYGQFTELGPIRRMCNAAREDGLASWFGTTQTFMVCVTAGFLSLVSHRAGAARWRWIGWLVLCLFLFYMSMDDGAEIHERMGSAFKAIHKDQVDAAGALTASASLLERFPSYTWQIVYAPVFGSLAVFLVVFCWFEFRTWTGRLLVVGTLSCFVLAVGMDFVEGLEEDHPWNLYTHIDEATEFDAFARKRFQRNGFDALRHFSKTTEETIEMFGMTLLWAAFLLHLPVATRNRTLIRFQTNAAPKAGASAPPSSHS